MEEKQQPSNISASKVCSRDKPKLSEVSRTPRVSVSSSNQFNFHRDHKRCLRTALKGWNDPRPTEREEGDGKLSFL